MAQSKHGTGTITKASNGKWRWQGYYVDNEGKTHRPSKTFNTEAEALKFQAEQITQAEVKKAIRSKDLTVIEVFEMWKGEVRAGTVKISETTRKNTIQNINKHIIQLIGNDKIKTLSTHKIQRYFSKLKTQGTSIKTIYNIYTDLKQLINYAIKKHIIYENPIADLEVEKPKTNKKVVNVMTFKEYELLMNCEANKKSYYYNAIMFLAETGLRVEELAIKKKDYHITDNGLAFIVIDKSIVRALKDDDETSEIILSDNVKNKNSERKVPLNLFAQNAIENQLQYCREHNIHSPFIFCTRAGTMLEQRNLLRALHMMCKNVGIEKRGLHSLRKMYINHCLKNGITPFDLAKITGHSMQTMFKYYHDLDEDLLQSVASASESRN